jgi:hypothetical protein
MPLPDSELQRALHEYQECGEKLRISKQIRISELLPQRTENEIDEILRTCKLVEDESLDIACAVRDHRLSPEEAVKKIKRKFPFMSQENLSRTYSQAMYYCLMRH